MEILTEIPSDRPISISGRRYKTSREMIAEYGGIVPILPPPEDRRYDN